MKKPIVALQTNLDFSQTLYKALEYHLFEGAIIIDPTPGKKHSWNYYLREKNHQGFFPLTELNIVFIDDDILSFSKTGEFTKKHGKPDAIFFDPPYIFGSKTGPDVRREDYGEYNYSIEEVESFFIKANEKFPGVLKKAGLLFVKYTDVFSVKDKKYFFCAARWPLLLSNFEIIDHYIIQHHHISPTAWQVKDRPCGIVNYTYLSVFRQGGTNEN